jgi:diacylglycerol kinase family enzyme
MDARICVICNEASGRNSREAHAVHAAMRVLGPRATLRRAKGPDIDDAARLALRQGFGTVVAAGGDGTIMTVAGVLAEAGPGAGPGAGSGAGSGAGARFGVLPLGTFNYFARGLGIPPEPEAAARVLLAGHTRKASLGEVNGRLFLNNVSVGIYPAILRAREDVYRRWGRRQLAAHWSVAKTFVRFQRPLHLTLTANGRTWRAKTPLLFAARSAFQLGSFSLAGADCVERGAFAVFVAPHSTRAGLFLSALRLARGRMRPGRDFDLTCTEEMLVASRSRHLTVACDGEKFRMRTPLRLTMRHDVLDVLAPPESAATGERAA